MYIRRYSLAVWFAAGVTACSLFVDTSGLEDGSVDASTSDVAAETSTDAGAPCTAESCAVGEVCCVDLTLDASLLALLNAQNGSCVETSACVFPHAPLGCPSSDLCAVVGGSDSVCCVTHSSDGGAFLSALCTAISDCHTSGPQDILCDAPDASRCPVDIFSDGGSRAPTCAALQKAGDGANFGGATICR